VAPLLSFPFLVSFCHLISSARSKKKTKSGPSVPLSESLQECYEILKFLQTHRDAQPFLEAVDWELYGLTDYPEIITHPMDFGTIQSKLDEGKYRDAAAFASDVRLVFDNCMKYNRPDSDLYMTADKLGKVFEKKFQKLKAAASTSATTNSSSTSSSSSASSSQKKNKKDDSSSDSTGVNSKEVSRADRLRFSQLVNQLSPEQLGQLVELIQSLSPEALNEEEEEEIEIEINQIDSASLQQLITFANAAIHGTEQQNKKQKVK